MGLTVGLTAAATITAMSLPASAATARSATAQHAASMSRPANIIPGGTGCIGDTLTANTGMGQGGYICSTNGDYWLIMQDDGNLVEYDSAGALWASDTDGVSDDYVIMQSDGNLVIYAGSGAAVWASGTWGIGGGTTFLEIQNDGNIVEYDSSGAVWARFGFAPQTYAQEIFFHYGWGSGQWPYLDDLWNDESGWNWWICYGGGSYPNCDYQYAAYGIPQADPGDKMAAAGPDWTTDGFTQVQWGMGYILAAYGTPEAAFDYATSGCPGGEDCHGYVTRGTRG
jgi:hypothetical protein